MRKSGILRAKNRASILGVITVMLGVLGVSSSAQIAPEPKPQMAEEVFKNVQVLKGIPVDEFMETMGFFSASLGLNCVDCHTRQSEGNWAHYADDTPLKQTARKMVSMVTTINKSNFGGARALTCYTCHRGDQRPKVVPSLALQYGVPLEDPNEIEIAGQAGAASADQIFEKYIQALGGAQRVSALTSFTAKGSYSGYDTDHQKFPLEVYAKAPSLRAMIVHMSIGGAVQDSVRTYDGRAGWIASPDKPVPLMALTGGNLSGAKLEALLSFPGQIKQSFSQWRAGMTSIEDRDVQVLQGTNAGQPPVKLYFDSKSGLLVRVVRYSESPVGRTPTQIDYDNYRDVAGVKMPFHWIVTWTDGQATIDLSDVQANVPIDASKFVKPAPAAPPKPTAK
jgi:photosynthetic reaction center cytochrome c subunit